MTGIAGHDPGISGHVRPESLVTLLRNTHFMENSTSGAFGLSGGLPHAIESVNMSLRKITKNRGSFPSD